MFNAKVERWESMGYPDLVIPDQFKIDPSEKIFNCGDFLTSTQLEISKLNYGQFVKIAENPQAYFLKYAYEDTINRKIGGIYQFRSRQDLRPPIVGAYYNQFNGLNIKYVADFFGIKKEIWTNKVTGDFQKFIFPYPNKDAGYWVSKEVAEFLNSATKTETDSPYYSAVWKQGSA